MLVSVSVQFDTLVSVTVTELTLDVVELVLLELLEVLLRLAVVLVEVALHTSASSWT